MQNGYINSIILVSLTLGHFIGGFAAQYVIKYTRLSKTTTRKLFEGLALCGSAVCFFLMTFVGENQWFAVTLLVLVAGTYGLVTGGDVPNVTDITTNYSATVYAIGNTTASTAMFFAPYIVGLLIDPDPHSIHLWNYVFYLSAILSGFGGVFFVLFSNSEFQEHKWAKD